MALPPIDPLIATGVVLSTAVTDAVYVMFNAAVSSRRRFAAANWSSLWYLLSAFAVISYTSNWAYVVFAAVGSWLGGFLSITALNRFAPPATRVKSESGATQGTACGNRARLQRTPRRDRRRFGAQDRTINDSFLSIQYDICSGRAMGKFSSSDKVKKTDRPRRPARIRKLRLVTASRSVVRCEVAP